MTPEPLPTAPPSPRLPTRLACQVIARDTNLDRRVLQAVSAGPRRYSELKPLLEGRNDHNLTVVLRRLQEEGVIDRRTSARERPPVHRYELSALGERVVAQIHRIEALPA